MQKCSVFHLVIKSSQIPVYIIYYIKSTVENVCIDVMHSFSSCLYENVWCEDYMNYMDDKYRTRMMLPELQVVDERELEEDREYLMQMYPAKARLIMVMIEDACDKLEYEGSPMFAMYPDRETILNLAKKIYEKIKYNDTDENLKYLIEVMMFNEFYVRRSRYKRRRKFF